MIIVYQNDQYSLAMTIKKGETTITGSNCDEMVIRVGDIQKSLTESEISYDTTLNKWLFPLTETQTKSMNKNVQVQARFTIGSNKWDTPVVSVEIGNSIIEV